MQGHTGTPLSAIRLVEQERHELAVGWSGPLKRSILNGIFWRSSRGGW